MNKITVIIFALFFIISCHLNKQNNNNIENESIDINSNLELLYKENIVKDIRYVPLKIVGDTFLIGNIKKNFCTDSLLFIFDNGQDAIFVYDLYGNPLSKIGSIGQGPGEYIYLSDVILDRERKRIIIYDIASRKIIHYDFSGRVLEEKKMPDTSISYFAKDPKSDFYIGERIDLKNDLLVVFDQNKNIVNSYLRINEKDKDVYKPYQSTLSGSLFYTFNDTVFYLSIFDYSIYSYVDGKFNKEYSLNIPEKKKITSASGNNENMRSFEIIDNYLQQGLVAAMRSFIVTTDFIFFSLWGGPFLHDNVLYDRKNKKSYFYEDLFSDTKQIHQNPLCTEYNGWFVFVIYYEEGLEYLRKNVGMTIKEDDNPVLCFVKLKNLHEREK
jgi:hypothetical protein